MRLAAIQRFDLSNSFDCVGLFSWINNLGQKQIISFFTFIESRSLLQRPAHDTAQQSFTGLGELHTPHWMVLCLFTKPVVHCSWSKVLEFIWKNLNPTKSMAKFHRLQWGQEFVCSSHPFQWGFVLTEVWSTLASQQVRPMLGKHER